MNLHKNVSQLFCNQRNPIGGRRDIIAHKERRSHVSWGDFADDAAFPLIEEDVVAVAMSQDKADDGLYCGGQESIIPLWKDDVVFCGTAVGLGGYVKSAVAISCDFNTFEHFIVEVVAVINAFHADDLHMGMVDGATR